MKKKLEDMVVEHIRTQADLGDIIELLEFGIEQTPRICEAVVEREPFLFVYIENQTPELCINALRRCNEADIENIFLNVKVRTPEVCMEAVKRDCFVVFHIENPSDELWFTAIEEEPDILADVIYPPYNKGYDFCLEAVKRNPKALKYIDNPYMRREIKKDLKQGLSDKISSAEKRIKKEKINKTKISNAR